MIVPRSDIRVVVRDIGGLQVLLAGATAAPLAVSLLYREWYSALGFAISIAIIGGLGAAAFRVCRRAGEPRGYHAMLIAGAGWLVSVLLGAIPLLLIAHLTPDDVAQGFVPAGETYRSSLEILQNPLHAIFESTSGLHDGRLHAGRARALDRQGPPVLPLAHGLARRRRHDRAGARDHPAPGLRRRPPPLRVGVVGGQGEAEHPRHGARDPDDLRPGDGGDRPVSGPAV